MQPDSPTIDQKATEIADFHGFKTRNTKEAATLYAIGEVNPVLTKDGKLHVMRVREHGTNVRDQDICWFFFYETPMADKVREAFADPDYAITNGGDIPDRYMPQVLALIVQTFHNWERCKDAAKSVPLHHLVRKGSKIYITPKGDTDGNH